MPILSSRSKQWICPRFLCSLCGLALISTECVCHTPHSELLYTWKCTFSPCNLALLSVSLCKNLSSNCIFLQDKELLPAVVCARFFCWLCKSWDFSCRAPPVTITSGTVGKTPDFHTHTAFSVRHLPSVSQICLTLGSCSVHPNCRCESHSKILPSPQAHTLRCTELWSVWNNNP